MSFASDVRGELARQPMEDACCARSELTAALLCGGGIAWRGRGRYAVTITAGEASTVRRCFAMLKRFYGIIGQIRTLSGDALNGQTRYQLAVPEDDAARLLDALGLLDAGALFGVRAEPPSETVMPPLSSVTSCADKPAASGFTSPCASADSSPWFLAFS